MSSNWGRSKGVVENFREEDIKRIHSTYNIMGESLTMSGGPEPSFKNDKIIYEGVEIGWLQNSYSDVLERTGMIPSDPAESIEEIKNLDPFEFVETRLVEVTLTLSFEKGIKDYGFRSEESDLVENLKEEKLVEKHSLRSRKIYLGFKEMDLILNKKDLKSMSEKELKDRMCVKVIF